MEFFTRSELRDGGRDEDGQMIVVEVFYVVVEVENGRRWAHNFSSTDEARVLQLLVKISAAGAIDLAHWQEVAARYGSASHNEADWMDDDDRALRREAGF